MFKLYTAGQVKKMLERVEQEYENFLATQRRRINELTEQNREITAKLSEYEHEQTHIASAIISAEKTGEEIRASADAYAKTQRESVYRLAERCRKLAETLTEKYPDEEDVRSFGAYLDKLDEALETNGQGELDMNQILYPSADLKLENLCKELGLMDDEDVDE